MPLTPPQICERAKANPNENDPTGSINELCNEPNGDRLVQEYIRRGRIDPETGFEIFGGGKKSKKSAKKRAKKSSKRRASKKARKTRRK